MKLGDIMGDLGHFGRFEKDELIGDGGVSPNGKWTFKALDGETGGEGGPSNLHFLISITNNETQETFYYTIGGYHDSWGDGTEYNIDNDDESLSMTEEAVMMVAKTFTNAKGDTVYTYIEEK